MTGLPPITECLRLAVEREVERERQESEYAVRERFFKSGDDYGGLRRLRDRPAAGVGAVNPSPNTLHVKLQEGPQSRALWFAVLAAGFEAPLSLTTADVFLSDGWAEVRCRGKEGADFVIVLEPGSRWELG